MRSGATSAGRSHRGMSDQRRFLGFPRAITSAIKAISAAAPAPQNCAVFVNRMAKAKSAGSHIISIRPAQSPSHSRVRRS